MAEASPSEPKAKRPKLEIFNAAMKYANIPGTDLLVSRVCLGTMQFSGSTDEGTVDVTWGAMSQEAVNETVDAALDCGINFFDCAEAYGKNNCAERALGTALKGKRDKVIIASKFGKHLPLWECDALPEEEMYRYYCKSAILTALDQSLAALQTDYIDLYQIHWPVNVGLLSMSKKSQSEVVDALEEAKSAGKIRYYGLCNFGTSDIDEFVKAGGQAVTNQLPYNLLWRSVEERIIPHSTAKRMGILCYSPLQQGLLAGIFSEPSEVPDGRRRTRLFSQDSTAKSRHAWATGAEVQKRLWQPNGVLQRLRQIGTEAGEPLAAVAVAWLLEQPGVTSVLVGASSCAQVRRNARIINLPSEVLAKCSAVTEELKCLVGNHVDQYAAVARIHGS